ncbi:putative glycosyltransferase EpsF [Cohnella abietis]|uniref:Putative glycosyltransferase EpsF n=2 Tax=Cohnella abietis TaxID=2507935 RepID=A0A3T1D1U8_9BACL|nr:putative glycosyltransferase EpsF [Cohnella abietis]
MNRKIKVLHMVGKMHPGGIESLLMNVYRHIDRSRYEFHFGVQTEEKAFYDDEIAALGGTIVRHPHPNKGLWNFRRALASNLQNHGPYDAVHSHIFGFSGYVLKIAKEMGVPVRISHSHNTNDSKRGTWIRTLYRAHMRRLIRSNATGMLGCSNAACESLFGTKCWGDRRVTVFPNAIDLSEYATLPVSRMKAREGLGLPRNRFIVGHIGRFSRQKNHAFLLERFEAFLYVRPDAHLLLIGDGPLRAEMEAKAIELGLEDYVSFLGVRKDVPELMAAMDLFLLPSLYEGLGIVLIEAQAAGVPCLVSDRVPKEADLGIGLVERLSLDKAGDWAGQMLKLGAPESSPTWDTRYQAIRDKGYDIGQSVLQLERMYGG